MNTSKLKTTRVTSSADVKAAGGPAHVYKVSIQNTGTAGTSGNVELRDAVTPAGDGGTLRYDMRHGSTDEDVAGVAPQVWDFSEGLYMPNGIRVTLNTVTNVIVWVSWDG